eukprot:scaffold14582_cov108-Isochrysis_galbana.AAC.2
MGGLGGGSRGEGALHDGSVKTALGAAMLSPAELSSAWRLSRAKKEARVAAAKPGQKGHARTKRRAGHRVRGSRGQSSHPRHLCARGPRAEGGRPPPRRRAGTACAASPLPGQGRREPASQPPPPPPGRGAPSPRRHRNRRGHSDPACTYTAAPEGVGQTDGPAERASPRRRPHR